MKQDDIDRLIDLSQLAATHTWTIRATPQHLDLASHLPTDLATATLFANDSPVATFWSYMHDGPRNGGYVAWMAQNVTALLTSKLDDKAGAAGLALLTDVSFRDWWPGPTPGYLAGGDADAITLRTPQHTEEIATLWGAGSSDAASLICWFVNAGADFLARAGDGDGVRPVIAAMLPSLERHARVKFAPDFEEAIVILATDNCEHQVPVSYALTVAAHACRNAQRDAWISAAAIAGAVKNLKGSK